MIYIDLYFILNHSVCKWHLNYERKFSIYVSSVKLANPLNIRGWARLHEFSTFSLISFLFFWATAFKCSTLTDLTNIIQHAQTYENWITKHQSIQEKLIFEGCPYLHIGSCDLLERARHDVICLVWLSLVISSKNVTSKYLN